MAHSVITAKHDLSSNSQDRTVLMRWRRGVWQSEWMVRDSYKSKPNMLVNKIGENSRNICAKPSLQELPSRYILNTKSPKKKPPINIKSSTSQKMMCWMQCENEMRCRCGNERSENFQCTYIMQKCQIKESIEQFKGEDTWQKRWYDVRTVLSSFHQVLHNMCLNHLEYAVISSNALLSTSVWQSWLTWE